MSHHCSEKPATVADIVSALQGIDQSLPVYEAWNEVPGWFEVDEDQGLVWLGVQKCAVGSDDGQCRNGGI